jgi:hypothetical protein
VTLAGRPNIFRQVPRITLGAPIGTKFLRRIRGRELRCRESFTLGGVLFLFCDRAFGSSSSIPDLLVNSSSTLDSPEIPGKTCLAALISRKLFVFLTLENE